MSADTEEASVDKDEFIKASVEALSRLVDRALRGDVEASEGLQVIAEVLTRPFKQAAPAGVQRALELRALKWSLVPVVKPSPTARNKKGSVLRGSIVIDEKFERHPLYAEAKKYANSRMTLKSLARRVFNARLEQEGRPTLEKSQFDADEQQLKQWEKEHPSHLYYVPPATQNAFEPHSRKEFSGEHDSLEDIEAIYSVEQTWRGRKIDKRRGKR
jgi:hypothetical protein